MAWHAKPSGGYHYESAEGRENIYEINTYFNNRGYTLESQAGIVGNIIAEGGLNPWRWESDTYNTSRGYGLFGFTPATGYLNGASHLAYFSPNHSTTGITSGATPEDGIAQLTFFADNLWGWMSTCWRSYWDKTTYAELYAIRTEILNTYGNGTSLTMEQFSTIDNVYYATFAFLACFEGPNIPNMAVRYEFASAVYEQLTGDTPITPVTPSGKNKKSIFMNTKFAIIARRLR